MTFPSRLTTTPKLWRDQRESWCDQSGIFSEEDVRAGRARVVSRLTDLGGVRNDKLATARAISELPKPAAAPPRRVVTHAPGEVINGNTVARSGLPWENGNNSRFVKLLSYISHGSDETSRSLQLMRTEGGRLSRPLRNHRRRVVFISALIGLAFGSLGAMGGQRNPLAAMFGAGMEQFHDDSLPIFIALSIFIGSAIIMCLMLVGGAKKSYETTLRVICFAPVRRSAAHRAVCGGVIAGIWG